MKKAIMVVSFGSSYEETLNNNIGRIENIIQGRYNDYRVVRSFTSSMIIRKLRKRGVVINSPKETFDKLIGEGYKEIIVQPLHIIPGYEYEKVELAVMHIRESNPSVNIKLSTPLIYHLKDYHNIILALDKSLPIKGDKHGYILMGHGTTHPSNAAYSQLQNIWNMHRNDITIANVEGFPLIGDVLYSVNQRFESITLSPLMLVAGEHAVNDMSSDDEESFKSLLSKSGINVSCELKGLGERREVAEIFVNKIKDIM